MSEETEYDWQHGLIEQGYRDAGRSWKRTPKVNRKATPTNPFPVVYLRCVDAGTDNECWVVCLKGDPGAVQFERS